MGKICIFIFMHLFMIVCYLMDGLQSRVKTELQYKNKSMNIKKTNQDVYRETVDKEAIFTLRRPGSDFS